MRIPLSYIAKYSQCPRRFFYLKSALPTPEDRRLAIAKSVINKAYNSLTETNHLVDWRRIIGWVDTQVFKGINISNEEAFKAARITAEQILSFLQSWYHTIYVKENSGVFTDLNTQAQVDNHTIVAQIPIVRATYPPSITYIDDRLPSFAKMYNDIKARGLAWALSSTVDAVNIEVQHIVMKPKGGFDIEEITVDKDGNQRARAVISQLADSISRGIDYPSVTQQCYECAFRRKCQI